MITLSIEQNQASYLGLFASPAFNLWKDRHSLIENLYQLFSAYDVSLSDMRFESLSRSPGGEAVVVDVENLGTYRLRYDRVEWVLDGFAETDFARIPMMLQSVDNWLRSNIKGFKFKTQVLGYLNHSNLSDGIARDYLLKFSNRDIPGIEQSLGSGIIYNWQDAQLGGRVQLIVDHSHNISDGLFVQFVLSADKDDLDFPKTVEIARSRIDFALAQIGLELEQEIE
jgi:hypothetical protein